MRINQFCAQWVTVKKIVGHVARQIASKSKSLVLIFAFLFYAFQIYVAAKWPINFGSVALYLKISLQIEWHFLAKS